MKDWRGLGQVLTTVLATGRFIQGADHQGTLQTLSMKVRESEVTQSCPTLCDRMDCSLPCSSVHGIFQARILEWVAISFSRRSSWSRDWTQVSRIIGRHFATRKAQVPFSSVQLLSHVWLFMTARTTTHQASLSTTNSRSLLKLISIESVMPSNHLILCHPLLLLPSIFPSIKVFSNESALHIRWPAQEHWVYPSIRLQSFGGGDGVWGLVHVLGCCDFK